MVIKNSIIAFNLLFLMFYNFNSMCMKREAEIREDRDSKKIKVEQKDIDIALMAELPLELIASIKDEKHISFSVIELANEEDAILPTSLPINIDKKDTNKTYAVPYIYYPATGITCGIVLVNEKQEEYYCSRYVCRPRGNFDGISNETVLRCQQPDDDCYTLYINKLASYDAKPFVLNGNGKATSLSLYDDKFVCCVYKHDSMEGYNYYLNIGHFSTEENECKIISTLKDQSLRKAIFLGKNTWFGLNYSYESKNSIDIPCGGLFSFWLDQENNIQKKFQKTGKPFYDIDVDRTIKTESGFMPRIALLSTNGDVYETDLTCFEKPRMLYTTNIMPFVGKINNVKRLVYDNQQCSIVYKKDGSEPLQYLTWPAQFNVVYACSLAKEMYAKQQRCENGYGRKNKS